MPMPELSNEDVFREAHMQPNMSHVNSGSTTSNNLSLQQGVSTRDFSYSTFVGCCELKQLNVSIRYFFNMF